MVNMNSELNQVFLGQRRKVLDPVVRVREFDDFFGRDIHLLHNFKLTFIVFGDLRRISKIGWVSKVFDFLIQFQRGCTDGHSCTMIAEGEQDIVPAQSFVPSVEITFGH